jgi:hypothetical protein
MASLNRGSFVVLKMFRKPLILLVAASLETSAAVPLWAFVASPDRPEEQEVITAYVMPTTDQAQKEMDDLTARMQDAELVSVISPVAEREYIKAKLAFRAGNYFGLFDHAEKAERALPDRSNHARR